MDAADEVVTSELLPDELLAACLGWLTLRSLPCVARVNHRWSAAAQVAFEAQLRWRADPRCRRLPLPVPDVPPAQPLDSHIHHVGFSLAFLRGGALVVQLVDATAAAVRTLCFADPGLARGADPPEPREAPRREFADHGPFNAGVGGVVGYRHGARDAPGHAEGMAFFPRTSGGGAAASDATWVAEGSWQNVLHAGNTVFLLRAHASWWEDATIMADVLDTDTGGRAAVDVTPLRDALRQQLGPDRPTRGAVSAAEGHFIFHMGTEGGAKVAAALRLPAHVPPQSGRPRARGGSAPIVPSGVAFARRWPASHSIARLHSPNEEPCGAYLMLWEERSDAGGAAGAGAAGGAAQTSAASADPAGGRFALDVVLLHASSGGAVGQALAGPAPDGPHSGVAAAFSYGGVGAIDYGAASGVVAACSLPRAGLPPPAVLVWDWRTAVCLQAVLFHPLPPEPPRRPVAPPGAHAPLRFPVGTHVACRMGAALWLPGVVAAHHVRVAPGQRPAAYLVHLERGDTCFAPLDHPGIIRAAADGEGLAWNDRTQTMEVDAEASLAVHPSSGQLAIGMWHVGVAAGVLYSVHLEATADGAAEGPSLPEPTVSRRLPTPSSEEGNGSGKRRCT